MTESVCEVIGVAVLTSRADVRCISAFRAGRAGNCGNVIVSESRYGLCLERIASRAVSCLFTSCSTAGISCLDPLAEVVTVSARIIIRRRPVLERERTVAGDDVYEFAAIGLLVIEALVERAGVDLDRDLYRGIRAEQCCVIQCFVKLKCVTANDAFAEEVYADVVFLVVVPVGSLTVEDGTCSSPRAFRAELSCGVEADLGEEVAEDLVDGGLLFTGCEVRTGDGRSSCKLCHLQTVRINGDDLHLRESVRVVIDINVHTDACACADVECCVLNPQIKGVGILGFFRSCGDRKHRDE